MAPLTDFAARVVPPYCARNGSVVVKLCVMFLSAEATDPPKEVEEHQPADCGRLFLRVLDVFRQLTDSSITSPLCFGIRWMAAFMSPKCQLPDDSLALLVMRLPARAARHSSMPLRSSIHSQTSDPP